MTNLVFWGEMKRMEHVPLAPLPVHEYCTLKESKQLIYLSDVHSQTDFPLKGQCHKNFCFRFFHESSYPKPVAKNGNNFRLLTPWRNLKENIYLYVNSTTQRCKKVKKTFLIEDFFHLPPVSMTPVVHLEMRISPRIFEKTQTAPPPMVYSGVGGNRFMKKT